MHCVYYSPEVGGLESHVQFLCRGLAARGHEVDVVTSRSRPGLAAFEVMDGVRVWRTWMPSRNTFGWASHAMGSVPRFGALAETVDVLHAQDIAAVVPCVIARSLRGTPFVTTYHTSHFLRRSSSPFWRPIFARFLAAADHNLAASEEIAAVAEGIAPGVRVEPLANGVDTSLFRHVLPSLPAPPAGRRRIVVPRRLFPKNGVEFAVKAVPEIARQVDVEIAVVGDGPERASLERLASELGVADRISFLGARPHADMPGLLSSAELALFPSLMEATSVAALESMACELPVAASRVGGLPEIVDEGVGTLFEPADPGSLARAVVRLLESPRRAELGRAARERVTARWTNDRLVERHLTIYEDLIAKRRAA